MKTIILTAAAAKDLDALPRDVCEAIESALDRYAMTGEADVSKLSGRQGYRMRVGQYRVVFKEDLTTVIAIYIGRRTTTTYRRH